MRPWFRMVRAKLISSAATSSEERAFALRPKPGPKRGVRRRRVAILGAASALLATWVLLAGRILVAASPPRRADAVLVLSGDYLGRRLIRGVAALQETDSGRLVVFFVPGGPSKDRSFRDQPYLTNQGITSDRVRFVGPVGSTVDEASFAAGLAKQCGWRGVVVVTSPYHTRRAGFLFRRAVGTSVSVTMVADRERFRSGAWWTSAGDVRAVVTEWLKGAHDLLYFLRAPPARDPRTIC